MSKVDLAVQVLNLINNNSDPKLRQAAEKILINELQKVEEVAVPQKPKKKEKVTSKKENKDGDI